MKENHDEQSESFTTFWLEQTTNRLSGEGSGVEKGAGRGGARFVDVSIELRFRLYT